MAPHAGCDQLGLEGDPETSEIRKFGRNAANELLRPDGA